MRLPTFGPAPALAVSLAALCLLAIAPLGSRLGWWYYGFGLYRLMPASGFLAVCAAVLCVLTLLQGWPQLRPRVLAMLVTAIALNAVLIYMPLQYAYMRKSLPAIHDITTDTDNPPMFKAVLAIREAEHANSVGRSPELVRLQKSAYPDLAPFITPLPVAAAFDAAVGVARSMPGWTIVNLDTAAGCIEASQQTRWFRFTDDVVIRIAPLEDGSRIDMRSTSRQGRSDYGVNAARIRAFMAALRMRVG
jgi:uncharacterized protein (DUF1499 family)